MSSTVLAAPKAAPEKKKHHYNQRVGRVVGDVIIYLILIIMSVMWLAPIVWILFQSFNGSRGGSNLFVPKSWTFQNYANLFNNVYEDANGKTIASAYNFFGYVSKGRFYQGAFLNTLWVAFATMIISTLLCLATSYAFSRLRFKARQPMMKGILLLGMFPGFLGMIVIYWIFKEMGLTQNLWELVIVYSGGAGMGYYISKGFFDTISKQIDEAAMVDGASRWQIFYKITLPLSKPIVVYTALTSFMGPWAEFITASYLLGGQTTDKTNWTVAILLNDMLRVTDGTRGNYWREFCAGAVIVAIPTSLLFIFMQKYYVSGVTGGAVKG
jgi:arabinogalactan oligomer/maltooligosaccharide transport system permease protein